MNSFCYRRETIFFAFFPLLFLFLISPCYALILPPDPLESTDHFALLNPASDGRIIQALVKVKAPTKDPLGPGELWALLQYKHPSSGSNKFHFAASKAVPIQGLSNSTPTLIEFDFSKEPIPAGAYHKTLLIYYQENFEAHPILISKYRPQQLFLEQSPDTVQNQPPPLGGTLIFGPITFIREREKHKTEKVSFSVSDSSGPYLLRLTNGTAEGTHRVSSALVKLNGVKIFKPSDFSQRVGELCRQVNVLSGENIIEVRLRSTPGAFITLELFRLDKHPCQIFGPQSFFRKWGKPVKEKVVFELTPQFFGPFTLNLINGDSGGSHRVDSATIMLNGKAVFCPADFNKRIRKLSQLVFLQTTNTLTVELRGAPGDFLTLEITGYDNIPPSVTIANPADGTTFKISPIAVNGTVDDLASSVTVNGIPVSVSSDGSFTLEEFNLSEGENIIKAVATDSCGNMGEVQIGVYLRTVPEGPYLLFCPEAFYERRPDPPEVGCSQEIFEKYVGTVAGFTDETAVSVTLNGILLPDGVEVSAQESIDYGIREGNFFWAFVNIPQVDGRHPFTVVVRNAEGGQTEATVYFLVDTVPPRLTVTSPSDGLVTNTPIITITGTLDDPDAMVRIGWYGLQIPVVDGSFSTTYTLPYEGSNDVAITARDPAENSSYVSLKVILDTQPPQINVTYPAEGEAVNTPTLSISGYIIDQYVNEVTVSVNDGQPQALTLTGTNFGGAVNLNPGQNRLTFNALDKAGNTATLTRSVLLDVTAPAVTITAPQTGVVFSGTIAVTAEASDVASGIASLTLYVDGQAQGILNQPPFNFKLDTSTIASGLHTITVRATDSAGNQAEASVSVTVDNTSPVVAITSPVSGAFVSGFITLSVQASDAISGIASVSLYVDGQLQTTRNQPPFDFSLNSLLFSSGSHTITARGIDTAGNQAETTITISFDHVAPAVSITSPAPGTVVSGVITVTVEASDSISEVANVTLYVDNQPRSTLDAPPFSFTVDTSGLAPDSHTLTARAIDRAGNQAEASISITVTESIRIEITSPLNGATINKSSTLVQGRLHNQTGEVGVTVNGLLAEAQGSDFAAILPLQVGQNTLTATATGPDGVQSQASITINTETQQEFVRLTTMPPSGILDQTGILNVTFEAEAYLLNPVSNYSWDFDGDGIPEITGTEATVIAQYQYPGLFFPRVAVTDTQGNIYTETTIVNVLSREEVDALLRSKWEGMRSRLLSGDIEGALVFLNEPKKEAYKKLLNALAPWLPAIVQEMSDIQLIEYIDNAVIYDLRTLRRGEEFSFQLLFEKDGNGVWKITSF